VRFTEENLEDWDFRGCYIGSPANDAEADLFLSTHYTTVVSVDYVRLVIISTLLNAKLVTLDDDQQHVLFTGSARAADSILKGMKSSESRLTSEGRSHRRVYDALRRETSKYGRLRVGLLPEPPEPVSEKPTVSISPNAPEHLKEAARLVGEVSAAREQLLKEIRYVADGQTGTG
jgi:hypothetical protein